MNKKDLIREYKETPRPMGVEDLWLENLKPYGEKGYNECKKTREERLRMIAANRKL